MYTVVTPTKIFTSLPGNKLRPPIFMSYCRQSHYFVALFNGKQEQNRRRFTIVQAIAHLHRCVVWLVVYDTNVNSTYATFSYVSYCCNPTAYLKLKDGRTEGRKEGRTSWIVFYCTV